MKNRQLLTGVALLVVGFLLGSLLRPMVVPGPAAAPAPVAPAPIRWVIQTTFPTGSPAFPKYLQWAQDVTAKSAGRLEITLHPTGTVVPLMEVKSAVTRGSLDGGIGWGPFWRGIDPVLSLACGQTSGLDALEFFSWLHNHGGLELIREAYARHNIHYIPGIPGTPETFLWAHRPIRTLADLSGLKVRAAGFSLDTFTRLGVTATFIPGADTPPALLTRVVDAGEFAALFADVAMGFADAAKFAMVGPRAPVVYEDLIINADRWKALPPDLQMLVTSTMISHGIRGHTAYVRLDAEALATAKARGVTFVRVSDELANVFRTTLDQILDEQAAGNPAFARIWESLKAFRTQHRQAKATLYPW